MRAKLSGSSEAAPPRERLRCSAPLLPASASPASASLASASCCARSNCGVLHRGGQGARRRAMHHGSPAELTAPHPVLPHVLAPTAR